MPEISVVVPAYNEEASIERVAQDAVDALEHASLVSYEIVLVDDGSTDQTRARMEQARQRLTCVRVVYHVRNRGLGAALRTGYAAATGRIVTCIPGDGQVDLGETLKGLRLLGECDIVFVLRRGRRGASRSFISFCFHALIRLLFRFDATDICGIYFLRRELLMTLDPKSNNVFYSLELPLLCVKHKKRIQRITVETLPRRAGVSKMANLRTLAVNLWEMLKYRIRG